MIYFTNNKVMAIWQYGFELISKNRFKDIDINNFEKDLEKIFGKIYEKTKDYIIFGDYTSDTCNLEFNNTISNIYCRFDFKKISNEKITKLFDLLEKYELSILVIEEKVLGTEKEFLDNIKKSNSLKFIKKGKDFFNDFY